MWNKKSMDKACEPKTILEAVESLQEFFEVDMWYSCNNEWKNEDEMLKYLKSHFDICIKQIKKIQKKKK